MSSRHHPYAGAIAGTYRGDACPRKEGLAMAEFGARLAAFIIIFITMLIVVSLVMPL